MADNSTLPAEGDIIAADEIGGVKHQRVKVQHGADGSATDVSAASPMPVADSALATLLADPASETTLAAVLAALGGTLAVDDADTQTALATLIGHVDGLEALLTTIDADTSRLEAIQTAVQLLDNAISGSEMQVDVVAALPAGTNAIGKLGANSGVDIGDVDVTSISAGSNLIGDVGLGVRTGSGLTVFRSLDLDETEEEIKGTAGRLYGYYFANLADSVRFLKLYNATAASVTVGSTTPLLTLPFPAGGVGHIEFPHGIPFSTAITAAATTGIADADTGAPGANEVVLNAFYA